MKKFPGYSKKYDKAGKQFLRLLLPKRRTKKKGCLVLLGMLTAVAFFIGWVSASSL
jgi:hypothetical protein